MAHGGDEAWNQAVDASVRALDDMVPHAVAYGMANPYTLRAALDSLANQGATRVAVVRMFLSGESFLDQTEYFLGLRAAPPESFVLMGPAAADTEARSPLAHDFEIATHRTGLIDSRIAGEIMADRAASISSAPEREAVLLLAHGMGDEVENDRVLAAMRVAAERVEEGGFADVEIATLREDWEEPRASAERAIRSYVDVQTKSGRSVLVLPMRLSGFGPYAEVLQDLPYREGQGLLPHPAVSDWVVQMANRIACTNDWGPVAGACAVAESPETDTRPNR